MAADFTLESSIIQLLNGRIISGERVSYHCIEANSVYVVFDKTAKSGKVMLPTEVVMEWIHAYEFGLINVNMNQREMRDMVNKSSGWSGQMHSFESHLRAIVTTWNHEKS